MMKLIKALFAIPIGFIVGVILTAALVVVLPFYVMIKFYNKLVFGDDYNDNGGHNTLKMP